MKYILARIILGFLVLFSIRTFYVISKQVLQEVHFYIGLLGILIFFIISYFVGVLLI
jgi:hypothetical protein